MNNLMTSKAYGDFQTPLELAYQITKIIEAQGINPHSIIEPTCGKGAFIKASLEGFKSVKKIIGIDINSDYLKFLQQDIKNYHSCDKVQLIHNNFFLLDWSTILDSLVDPILIIGNPPWITNSQISKINGNNLPNKSNFQGYQGLDALTGKSNFDISEWMIIQYVEWLKHRQGTLAVLCKNTVARKVLVYGWRNNYSIEKACLYPIDSLKLFNASVDAVLLILSLSNTSKIQQAFFFNNFSESYPSKIWGYHNDSVINDLENYHKYKHLYGEDKNYIWRSGIKHDSTKIMELTKQDKTYKNGFGVNINLDNTYIYPLLKSSDLANKRVKQCRKYVLVTQKYIGEDTTQIEQNSPQTWRYLQAHFEALNQRKSTIYKNRPPFSIFGVGDYTFAPWKVAISGFYKQLEFKAVGLIEDKPVIFDDTVYFLACYSENEANFIAELLNSKPAKLFLNSMIFWSDKRPITINLLKRLNIRALAQEIGQEKPYLFYIKQKNLFNIEKIQESF